MTATLPQEKIDRLRDFSLSVLKEGSITVHDCEKILGQIESVRPVTPLAACHYRGLQLQLLKAKAIVRDPNQIIFLSQTSK